MSAYSESGEKDVPGAGARGRSGSASLHAGPSLRGPNEPFLRPVLEAIERQGIRYAWLRGFEEAGGAGLRELDLLIPSGELPRLAEVLLDYGFRPPPSWGHDPHRFFVAHDRETGRWWKLDVVTDLRYGRSIRALRVGDVESCLRRCGPDHLLSPEDEFVALLLHCLLDCAELSTRHRTRLAVLARQLHARPESGRRAGEQVERWLAPALTWPMIVNALESQDWSALTRRRSALTRHLFRNDPLMVAWRRLSGRSLRLLRPMLFSLLRRGSSIVLLGPDGAGKSTLARALEEEKPLRARRVYMGTNRESANVALPAARWIEEHRKALGPKTWRGYRLLLKGLGFASRLAEQWYRYAVARYHLLRGRLVIFDRYVYDALATTEGATLRARLRRRLLRAGAPAPDLVVVLDAPGDVLWQRKREHTPELLERQRRAYLELRDRLPRIAVVDATRGADAVRKTVVSLVWSRYDR